MKIGLTKKSIIEYIVMILGLIAIDQFIKICVRSKMAIGESIDLPFDFLKITYIENRGMAFGMLQGKGFVLIGVTSILILIIAFMLFIYAKEYGKLFASGAILILAGGISNLADRIIFQSVTDYIWLKHFAIFNFADICACVGCVFFAIAILFFENKKEQKKD